MASPDGGDLEARMSLLEREMARLREEVLLAGADATAARTLAAGADRDVSEVRAELRAHLQVLNALRETQLDQGRRLDDVDRRMAFGFADLEGRMAAAFADVEGRMAQGFAMLGAGMGEIKTLLDGLTRGGSN